MYGARVCVCSRAGRFRFILLQRSARTIGLIYMTAFGASIRKEGNYRGERRASHRDVIFNDTYKKNNATENPSIHMQTGNVKH